MMGTPFRDSVVVNTWPYLGAALTSSVDDSHIGTLTSDLETANELFSENTGVNADAGPDSRNALISMGAVVLT